jgi:chemotaxis response regulator CheB
MEEAAVRRDIIVIGASVGGVGAFRLLAADLAPEFPASILIVLHVGAKTSFAICSERTPYATHELAHTRNRESAIDQDTLASDEAGLV